MFKKILVPVDGSETAWRALKSAVELGQSFQSEIIVFSVVQPYNNSALLAIPMEAAPLAQSNVELNEIGRQVLETAKEMTADYQYKISYEIEMGHPSERIIAKAKKADVDSIVLGCRGLSGIAEFFLGSVSSKVSQYASVPVLIVK